MHIHILGICGTFMGGLALLAKQAGHKVSGSDANVYPPMSTQLEAAGIELVQGYEPDQLNPTPDIVVIGNALSRGNPAVEHVLSSGLAYTSGPQWLAEHFLKDRWVLAVAGTHGKTTTSSLLAWILEDAGLSPGFLIGGVPANFGVSARAGEKPFFVIEADEYDTAFFDKRSKFIHYHPRTLILNNLEFDHADIFDDLDAIKRQFHHLVRTIPGNGLIVYNQDESNLDEVLKMGCWSGLESFSLQQSSMWQLGKCDSDGMEFKVILEDADAGETRLSLPGVHNQLNALAAIAAARHAGVPVKVSLDALKRFQGIKRRMELRGEAGGVKIYDDFAHHPTAIRLTLRALREKAGIKADEGRILAVFEPRSNTMKMGVHQQELVDAFTDADAVFLFKPEGVEWSMQEVTEKMAGQMEGHVTLSADIEELVKLISAAARDGDHILIMSNGGFANIHQRILDNLS